MEQETADITVIMLAKNSVHYDEPVDDPLFSTHTALDYYTLWGSEEAGYLSDFPVSMFGCTQQYQFCFARKGQSDYCTDLTGLPGKLSPSTILEQAMCRLRRCSCWSRRVFCSTFRMQRRMYCKRRRLRAGRALSLPCLSISGSVN